MNLFTAFALLLAASVAVLAVLAGLVVGRKARRDRRQSASARRRTRLRAALAGTDRPALRRALGAVRGREAQIDLAAVLQDPATVRPDQGVLEAEVERSGLAARLRAQLDARSGPARGRAVLVLSHLRLRDGVTGLEPMLDDDDVDVRLVTCAGRCATSAASASRRCRCR